jgi:Acetyltransferase (GNAT) domain
MSDDEGASPGHRCLIAYSRAMTQWASKGSLSDDEGVLLQAGGSWVPVIGNGAFRTDDSIVPSTLITRADAFFGQRKRGYSVKVRDTRHDDDLRAACEEHGLAAFGGPVPQMICRQPLGITEFPEGVSLRRARDEEGIADFVAVNRDAYATYGMPAEVFDDLFDRPARLLADTDIEIVLAYLDSKPVATALTFRHGTAACVQWVGTLRVARRMGLGRAVTALATDDAFAKGATAVTLQASSMGEPVYAGLGYETQYHYQEYARWDPPPVQPSGTGTPPAAADR